MCARLTSLLLATAWVAGVGCASKPAEEPSAAAAVDRACATSSTASQANDQAQTNQQDGGGGASAEQRAGDAGLVAGAAVGGTARATANATAAHAISIRKASLPSGRGGNGATAPKVVPGNDNETVARRLRKAAEQETNPVLRAKLWKEYTDYRQGTAAK
jgi:hypothetical protein